MSSCKISSYLTKQIRLSDNIDISLPLNDFACLNTQKCVILSQNCFLILNLNHQDQGEIKRVELGQKGLRVHPLLRGFCIQSKDNLMVFDDSGQQLKIMTLYTFIKKQLGQILTKINHPDWNFQINNKKELFVHADQSQTVATSFNDNLIKLLNLRTGERTQLLIPFNDRINKVFLVNKNHGVCVRRVDGVCSLWMVQFKVNGQCYLLKNIPNQSFIRLNKFNKKKQLLMFSSYSNVFVYHYGEERVICQWELNYFFDITNKISFDFNHIVSIKSTENNISIVHQKGIPQYKKIIMKLIKQSYLAKLYPMDSLIRAILKIADQ